MKYEGVIATYSGEYPTSAAYYVVVRVRYNNSNSNLDFHIYLDVQKNVKIDSKRYRSQDSEE